MKGYKMLNKELIVINKDSKSLLIKSKNLIDITSEILDKQDNWTEILWNWANENSLSESIFPRNKKNLLNIENLKLYGKNLYTIPDEIIKLKNLVFLDLANNQLMQLPLNIGNLKNLVFLSVASNNITHFPESIIKLTNLKNLWLNGNNIKFTKEQLVWINTLKQNNCYVY